MFPYSFAVLLVVIVSVISAQREVCPGYGFVPRPENCESTCSRQQDECPLGRKCCFRIEQPCGFHCVVPKINEPKAGKCPSRSSQVIDAPDWGLCDVHMCDVDTDCNGAEKCCYNMCHAPVCVAPQ